MIKPPSNHQAHHIVPWEFWDHPAVQKAAKSGNFHLNAKGNGLPIHNNYHNGSHYYYNREVELRLNSINLSNNPNQVAEEIINIHTYLRNEILSNPNTKINDLFN